jgi:virginiamycin A acetyltransferase
MKGWIKHACQILAKIAILPLYLTYLLGAWVKTPNDSLVGHSHLLALLPGRLGSYVRVAFYQWTLEYCDASACIEFGTLFSKTETSLGKNVYIGPYSQIGSASIEDNVLIGPSVLLLSGPKAHGYERLDQPIREQPGTIQRVTIGTDSWVGAGAIVMADIAPQTIVGAGSVVTKNYAPQQILAGNPARPIRSRIDLNLRQPEKQSYGIIDTSVAANASLPDSHAPSTPLRG